MPVTPAPSTRETIRIAAVGDLHCRRNAQGMVRPLFKDVSAHADLLLLCGDLTDHGQPEEAQILARELTEVVKVPIIAILGNHDVQADKQDELNQVLTAAGIQVLDGDAVEVHGVGFAGIKGFGGGFGRRTLEPWGEETIKRYVREAVDEALKLESALATLRTTVRVAVMHYAPIRGTVEGEPLEIYPFLGSSRFEDPIDRYDVTAVFHGHAHSGSLEGRTRGGVPVYNVALPLLKRSYPHQPPFRLLTLQVERGAKVDDDETSGAPPTSSIPG